MNKHQAIKLVKELRTDIEFINSEHKNEIDRLTSELNLNKHRFKEVKEYNIELLKNYNEQTHELNELRNIIKDIKEKISK